MFQINRHILILYTDNLNKYKINDDLIYYVRKLSKAAWSNVIRLLIALYFVSFVCLMHTVDDFYLTLSERLT